MTIDDLAQMASDLVADGKGILAADESVATLTRRFARLGIHSYGRALQDPALEAWDGRDDNVGAGQQALSHRARCNRAASLGTFTDDMETAATAGDRGASNDD